MCERQRKLDEKGTALAEYVDEDVVEFEWEWFRCCRSTTANRMLFPD